MEPPGPRVMVPFPNLLVVQVFPDESRVIVPLPNGWVTYVLPEGVRVMVQLPTLLAGGVASVTEARAIRMRIVFMAWSAWTAAWQHFFKRSHTLATGTIGTAFRAIPHTTNSRHSLPHCPSHPS